MTIRNEALSTVDQLYNELKPYVEKQKIKIELVRKNARMVRRDQESYNIIDINVNFKIRQLNINRIISTKVSTHANNDIGLQVRKQVEEIDDLIEKLNKKDVLSLEDIKTKLKEIVGPAPSVTGSSSFFRRQVEKLLSLFSSVTSMAQPKPLKEHKVRPIKKGKVKQVYELNSKDVAYVPRKERGLFKFFASKTRELKREADFAKNTQEAIGLQQALQRASLNQRDSLNQEQEALQAEPFLAINVKEMTPTELESLPKDISERIRQKPLVLTTQQAQDDLENFIKDKAKDESYIKMALNFGLHILRGMNNLHMTEQVHGDLKLENVLVYKQGDSHIAKVADFGKAAKLASGQQTLYRGNPRFMAPECQLSQKSEVYSVAIMLIRLLEQKILSDENGKMLLPVEKPKEKQKIKYEGIEKFLILHPACKQCIESPIKRISQAIQSRLIYPNPAGEHAVHMYIDKLVENLTIDLDDGNQEALKSLLKSMTKNDPAQRPTMKEALIEFEKIVTKWS